MPVDEVVGEAGLALSDEVGPAALVRLADGTRVVISGEALLAAYDEREGAALLELEGNGIVVC